MLKVLTVVHVIIVCFMLTTFAASEPFLQHISAQLSSAGLLSLDKSTKFHPQTLSSSVSLFYNRPGSYER